MDVAALLERVRTRRDYAGQLEHVEVLPARPWRFTDPVEPLAGPLKRVLACRGVERLYSHQAVALEAARAGRDWVVVTGTASGKTLCYNLPILEAGLGRPSPNPSLQGRGINRNVSLCPAKPKNETSFPVSG